MLSDVLLGINNRSICLFRRHQRLLFFPIDVVLLLITKVQKTNRARTVEASNSVTVDPRCIGDLSRLQ